MRTVDIKELSCPVCSCTGEHYRKLKENSRFVIASIVLTVLLMLTQLITRSNTQRSTMSKNIQIGLIILISVYSITFTLKLNL